MRGRRDRFIVATKIGWQNFDSARGQTAYHSAEQLIAGIESNLHRLQTDYTDICRATSAIVSRPWRSSLRERLQKHGKIQAYGVSTSAFEYLKHFNHDGRCSTLQIDYSILNRTPEEEIFPYCQEHSTGVIDRGALAMGILTGKFTAETQFAEGDFRQNWQTDSQQRAIFLDDLENVERLRALTNGPTLAQLAVQFVLAHPALSTVIPGAKSAWQIQETVQALQTWLYARRHIPARPHPRIHQKSLTNLGLPRVDLLQFHIGRMPEHTPIQRHHAEPQRITLSGSADDEPGAVLEAQVFSGVSFGEKSGGRQLIRPTVMPCRSNSH
jgi:aryl-alcohol dehydrogenase-like predicted oxidoreductase